MAKNVVLILEYGDGGYSCYNDEPLGNYAVIDGDGATAEEAKADFMKALQECRDDDPDVIKSIKCVKLYSTFYISYTIRTNGLLYLTGHNECPLLTILLT